LESWRTKLIEVCIFRKDASFETFEMLKIFH
jgi:hypothetical protein